MSSLAGQTPVERLKGVVRSMLPELVYRPIRSRRVARIVETYETKVVRHRYGRRQYSIVLADPLAEGWYDHDWDELVELALLARHRLRTGATVFDLGAHQAVVALMIADYVGSSGRVVAVEAEPHNVKIGQRNIELNCASNVELVHAAAARAPGRVSFSPGLNGRVGSKQRSGTVRVRAVSVDELSAEVGVPDVLFVDVEGHELEVLRGASESLREKPDLFIEVHQGVGLEDAGGTAEEVIQVVREAGYEDLLVSAAEGEPFLPWGRGSPIPPGRFFLMAQATDVANDRTI
jgi:FkbM family methyltransferase